MYVSRSIFTEKNVRRENRDMRQETQEQRYKISESKSLSSQVSRLLSHISSLNYEKYQIRILIFITIVGK